MTENTQNEISGSIERITYHSEENGFVVLQIKTKFSKDLTTVTGSIHKVSVGENIIAQGVWFNNPKFGLQFKASSIKTLTPTTIHGIEKYLGSGFIKGIGSHFASKIVIKFGLDTINVIENSPHKLKEIQGIGDVRIDIITKSWQENKVIQDIMIFLQSYNISASIAVKIFRTYGNDAIAKVKENPYQLARDIRGIGFLSADKIALSIGIDKDSAIRARAAINHILFEEVGNGNCAFPARLLMEQTEKKLDIKKDVFIDALVYELASGRLVALDLEKSEDKLIYLAPYLNYELAIADRLRKISDNKERILFNGVDINESIDILHVKYKITLSQDQKEALNKIASSKVFVITGGPGTGKTTLINALLKILIMHKGEGVKIKLAAPTGRAAKRMSEATKMQATTIHRLLDFDPKVGKFRYNEYNTLDCDLLIVDESSMIDIQLMSMLLKSLPNHAHLILVGDIDQIPSVGPGQVLSDIINTRLIEVVFLNKIFRQAANSKIITNAHLINKGLMPEFAIDKMSDFLFIPEDLPEDIISSMLEFIQINIKRIFPEINLVRDIQILSPMQRGSLGVKALNISVQKMLNPQISTNDSLERYGTTYSIGDKVMHIENDYNKNVFNGDIGFIHSIDKEDQIMVVTFDSREVSYDFADLDQLVLGYAITIHKSQGSEYPIVIIPITTQHFIMLNKNLLYTGVTRAKEFVVLVGQKKAIAISVKNKTSMKRYSKLKDFIIDEFKN